MVFERFFPKGTPACRALFLGLRNSGSISANICSKLQWELQYLSSVSLVFSSQFILAFAPSVGGEDKLASCSSTDPGRREAERQTKKAAPHTRRPPSFPMAFALPLFRTYVMSSPKLLACRQNPRSGMSFKLAAFFD